MLRMDMSYMGKAILFETQGKVNAKFRVDFVLAKEKHLMTLGGSRRECSTSWARWWASASPSSSLSVLEMRVLELPPPLWSAVF